jgi:hypothetical protein
MIKPHFTNTDNPIDFPKSEVNPMKEKIRQFARESGLDIYGLGKDRTKWEDTMTKFAELIVRECIKQARKDENGPAYEAVGRIAEHFGVE